MNIQEVVVKDLVPTIIPFDATKPDVTLLMMKSASVGLLPDGKVIKDLGGDYFKSTTDFGDKRVKTVRAFFDHCHNADTNPYMFPAKQLIGAAHVVPKDEAFYGWLEKMGLDESEALHRWYLVELEKSNVYHDYILALNNMKVLGASTQAYRGGVIRQDDGGIDMWLENEVTMTVQPMDNKLIGSIYELAKSMHIPVSLKKDFIMPEEVVVVAENETPGTPVPEESLETAIETIINGNDSDTQEEETIAVPAKMLQAIIQTQSELKDMYTSISAHMDMYANLSELPELIRTLQAVVGAAESEGSLKYMLVAIENRLKDTNKGILNFAEHVTKNLKLAAGDATPKSDVEKQAREEAKNNIIPTGATKALYFPPNAPGA